jgi:hypothetical protein
MKENIDKLRAVVEAATQDVVAAEEAFRRATQLASEALKHDTARENELASVVRRMREARAALDGALGIGK